MFEIHPDDLTGEPTRRLLALRLVTVWSVCEADDVIGALKELGDGRAEVKSMRTHPIICAGAWRRCCWTTSCTRLRRAGEPI